MGRIQSIRRSNLLESRAEHIQVNVNYAMGNGCWSGIEGMLEMRSVNRDQCITWTKTIAWLMIPLSK